MATAGRGSWSPFPDPCPTGAASAGNAGSQTAAFPAAGQRAGHRSNSAQIADSGQPGKGGEWDEEHDAMGRGGVLILWRERDTAEDFLEEWHLSQPGLWGHREPRAHRCQGQRTIARAWDPQGPVCSKEEATAETTWVAVRQKAGEMGAGADPGPDASGRGRWRKGTVTGSQAEGGPPGPSLLQTQHHSSGQGAPHPQTESHWAQHFPAGEERGQARSVCIQVPALTGA